MSLHTHTREDKRRRKGRVRGVVWFDLLPAEQCDGDSLLLNGGWGLITHPEDTFEQCKFQVQILPLHVLLFGGHIL
jgi:hypothetical protein